MCNGNAQVMDRVRKKIEVKEEKRRDVNMLRKTGIGLGKRLK